MQNLRVVSAIFFNISDESLGIRHPNNGVESDLIESDLFESDDNLIASPFAYIQCSFAMKCLKKRYVIEGESLTYAGI